MSKKRDNLLTLAAQALEFSAHAVQRRGILPEPDHLSKDAADAIALLALETQLDHLRKIGYHNVAALFDPSTPPNNTANELLQLCTPSQSKQRSEQSSPPPTPSIENSLKTPPPA